MSRRAIKGAVHNFLGTFTSRYSDYDGYWLFGFIVAGLQVLEIDLLHPGTTEAQSSPLAELKRLAVQRFTDQIQRAGIAISQVREATLTITRLLGPKQGSVNGRISSGFDVMFSVRVVSDHGKTYESALSIFVVPHNPEVELRSTRDRQIGRA